MMDSLTANQPITDTSVLICLPKGKFAIHNCIVYLGRGMWMWKVHDQTSICDKIRVTHMQITLIFVQQYEDFVARSCLAFSALVITAMATTASQ